MKKLTLILTVLALPLTAAADAPDSFGADARVAAMGGAGTALIAGGPGAYYNPGACAVPGKRRLTLGFLGAQANFQSTPDVVVGYDADDRPIVADVNNDTDFVGGFFVSSSIPIKKRFAFAFMMYMPAGRVVRIQTQDPFLPTYSMYTNRQQRLTINLAAGAQLFEGVHLGVGASVLATNRLSQGFNVPAGEEDENRSSGHISLDIVPRATPTAGLRAHLGRFSPSLQGVSAAVTYRGELYLPVDIEFFNGADTIIRTGPSLAFRQRTVVAGTIALIEHYTPAQVAAGLAYDRPDRPFALTADVTWMRWSAYRGPYIAADYEPMVVPPMGELQVNWRQPPTDTFNDTFVPRVGAEWRSTGKRKVGWALRGGYAFEATPIPAQDGETNLLDSDKHIATAGAGLTFPAPFGLTEAPMTVDFHAQVHQLRPRTTTKQVRYDCADPDERPPVGTPCSGSIEAAGNVLAGGASVTLVF